MDWWGLLTIIKAIIAKWWCKSFVRFGFVIFQKVKLILSIIKLWWQMVSWLVQKDNISPESPLSSSKTPVGWWKGGKFVLRFWDSREISIKRNMKEYFFCEEIVKRIQILFLYSGGGCVATHLLRIRHSKSIGRPMLLLCWNGPSWENAQTMSTSPLS